MNQYTRNNNGGFWLLIFANLLWGSLPIFWKLLASIPAAIILADRIIWTLILTVLLVIIHKNFIPTIKTLKNKKDLGFLVLRSLCLLINWLTYIWGVNNNYILDCSIGYFISPLITVFLGWLILKEKLTKWQLVSIIIVGIAILNLALGYGRIPWLALTIGLSFSLYSLFRKTSNLDSLPGLTSEMCVLVIPAIIYLSYFSILKQQFYFMNETPLLNILLVLTGVVTAAPLLLYASAIRKIKLSSAGVFQYITPTVAFFIGVLIYKEPLSYMYMVTFSIIWIGVILFSCSNRLKNKRKIKAFD